MTSALNEKTRKKSVKLETRAIKPTKELAVSSESATSSLEKEYNDALSALNKVLDDIKKSNEPALTVEGITIPFKYLQPANVFAAVYQFMPID